MRTDFIIIACASLNNIDLVFSEDKKSMLGKYCIDAYKTINLQKNIRTPAFYTYKQLKRSIINEIFKKNLNSF